MTQYVRIADGIVRELIAMPVGVPPDALFPPDDLRAIVEAPDNVRQGWSYSGKTFSPPVEPDVAPPTVAELVAYAAAKRYAVETGGIAVQGTQIATDRESQAMIGNAFAYVQAASAASVSYKSLAGFVTLTADQIKGVALAVGAHVQACFEAEANAFAKITAKKPTITDMAAVDAAFASLTA